MNSQDYQSMVSELAIGKRLPTAQYLHKSLLTELPLVLSSFVESISHALKLDDQWNLIKLHRNEFKISYLSYPQFETSAYPSLRASYVVDLDRKKLNQHDYTTARNKPILHRKETLVGVNHPFFAEFCLITKEGEQAGMYEDTSVIGYSHTWEVLMKQRGYSLTDGRLFRDSTFGVSTIDRKKTAINRYYLSTPFQLIRKAGLISASFTYLDYGCGRGDDLNILRSEGYDIIGWDPNHRPEGKVEERDIVNIGFVINVIEDRAERQEALRLAYKFAKRLLVVSAMIATEKHIEKFKPYSDGVITSRNTFQKYYTQDELREYIADITGSTPTSLGQGVFAIFKDNALENSFFESKYRRRRERMTNRVKKSNEEKLQEKIQVHIDILSDYWVRTLELGRFPKPHEYEGEDELLALFPSRSALNANLLAYFGEDEFNRAEQDVRDDLILIQAMSTFSGKRIFKHLNEKTQSEVKYFFGNFSTLQSQATTLLAQLNETSKIASLSTDFYSSVNRGYLEENKALVIHKEQQDSLPLLLRAYIGCACQLYGDLTTINLIKIHFHSGKVSFLGFDEFESSPLPLLRERIKINLWMQRVGYFDYVEEYVSPTLYLKSKFLAPESEEFGKQTSFDQKLDLYGFAPLNPNFGPRRKELDDLLKHDGLEIRGYRFYQLT